MLNKFVLVFKDSIPVYSSKNYKFRIIVTDSNLKWRNVRVKLILISCEITLINVNLIRTMEFQKKIITSKVQ